MAGPWERYKAGNPAAPAAAGPWARYSAPAKGGDESKESGRGFWRGAGDTVIEVGASALGGISALGDFALPGNPVSQGIDKAADFARDFQSDEVKAGRRKFQEDLAKADTVAEDLAAVGDYIVENPLQATAQAVGSFLVPGGAIKLARGAAGAAGLGARAVTGAGRAAGVASGAALGGGDAAGNAYDLVMKTPDDVLLRSAPAQELLKQRRAGMAAGEPAQGMLEPGNIDLASRPVVTNPDGSISTVRSMSIGVDGREVLIPTVSDDGRVMSDDEAVREFERTGRHLGVFDSPADATAYAERLHAEQERMYAPPSEETVREIRETLARQAGRDASILPAIAGGVSGLVGAEKILAGAGAARGGLRGIAATGAVEAATEAAEEGLTQYEGQRAAQQVDPDIDPTKNVAAMAGMGAVQGGVIGAGVRAATGGPAAGAGADESPAAKYRAAAAERAAQEADAADPGGLLALPAPERQAQLPAPAERPALPAPEGYSAGDGFTARAGWRMPANAPRGIRNNNPGNIERGVGFQGEVEGNDPRFATFRTPEDGIRATARNLLTYQRQHGLDTVEGIVGRWAPDSENDTEAYARSVAGRMGVAPSAKLDLSDPATLAKLTDAIIRHENGMQPYPAEMIDAGVQAAYTDAPARRALPAPTVTVDAEGTARTADQRTADRQRAEAAGELGMTPDVAAAARQHPGHSALDEAANAAATSPLNDLPEPSDAQKKAGNYKVGRTRVAGLDISIENPAGSERSGTSPDGQAWTNRMAGHYGYIRRTEGADGDHVDVFVKPGTAPEFDGQVFVIDQVDPKSGKFDEAKVMLGYGSQKEAEQAYRNSYSRDWKGMGKVTAMDVPTFRQWLANGDTKKPAAEAGLGALAPEGASAVKSLPSARSAARAITLEPGPDGKYAVSVESREVGQVNAPGGALTSRDQVASALAALRKAPQEQMVALFTDEAGRPISILRHTIGRKSSTAMVSGLIAGHAARLRGAANVWLAHNHPSGDGRLSPADVQVTKGYRDLVKGGRVKVRGMLAIGKSEYGHYDPESGEQGISKIAAVRRGSAIPVTERVFRRRATLSKQITGPNDAKQIMRDLSDGEDGIMLLNAKNEPTAFVPMAASEMAKLRGTGGLDKALAGLERSNASGAILGVSSPGDLAAAQNLARMLGDADVQVHDIIAAGRSTAALGQSTVSTKPFESKRTTRARDAGGEVTVQEGQRAARDFMAKLPGAASLKVSVVQAVKDIPEGARPSAMAEGAYYPAGERGRIYLVADNLGSMDRLHQVLAHEVVGHFGVEALLGDRFPGVLADVRRLSRAPEGAKITGRERPGDPHYATMESVTLSYPDYSSANRAREVLARMAETNQRRFFLDALYGKLRAALRAMGFNLKLTAGDLRQMVIDAGRFLRTAPADKAVSGVREAAASMAASEGRSASRRGPAAGRVAISKISGAEFGDPAEGVPALRERAKAWAAENLRGQKFHNAATGWDIHVGGRGIKETISRSARLEKLQSVAALPDLLRRAVLSHSAAPKSSADTSTRAMHTMYAPVEIGGQMRVARLMIREANNGEFFYDHDISGVSKEKALEAASNIGPGSKPGDMGSRSRAELNVDQMRDIVNAEGRAGWTWGLGEAESRGGPSAPDTPAFRRWFGDSKVVDAEGKPLVVYHGTNADFSTFDPAKRGSNTGWSNTNQGFFFIADRKLAEDFARDTSGGGRVMDVYLSIQKPIRLTTQEIFSNKEQAPTILEAIGGERLGPDEALQQLKEDIGLGEFPELIEALSTDEARAVMERDGYDGVISQFGAGNLEYVAFRPEQIKSASGNRGTFDASSPDILESRSAATAAGAPTAAAPAPGKTTRPGETLSATEQRLRDRALGKIGAFAGKDTLAQRLAKLRERAGEKLVQGVFDQFAPLKGINEAAYMQARLSKGTDGAAEYLVRHGAVRLQDGAIDGAGGKGLAEILAGLNGEHDHFMAWIAGNRAERLKAEGRERLFTDDDIDTLKKLNLGKMADGRRRQEVYAEALKELNTLQRSVLDLAQEAGLINGEARKLWEHEFYVPFYRVMEDDATGTMGPGQIAGLVGQRAFKKLKGGQEKLGDLTANTVANWSHLLSASMKNLAARGALKSAVELGVAERIGSAEKGSVRVMVDGKERHYLVDDPLVLDALTSLHYVGSNDPFMKAMRKFKHALTVGVTISPTFRVRNMLRDSLQAIAIDSDIKLNPLANMIQGWKATGAQSDTMRTLLAGGGAVRFGSFNDGQARNVKRLVDELGASPDDVIASPAALRRAMRKAFDWYQETGDRAETINRAAIYKAARAKGKSHLEASYAARDLMDFTAGGTFAAVRILSQVVPFLNARLQGMYKLGRGAGANPARFGAVAGAVGLASALLYLTMKDDEDYKKLPDWARNTYWVAKLPGTDRMVYIPKPFEIGALGTVIERGTELAFGGDDYRLGDFADTMAGVLGDQLAMNPIPQAVKPAMEVAFNYDTFRGRAIDSVGQQRLPAGERFSARTSAGAVALGRALGVSPQRLEHLARGYFGWLGMQALNVADYLGRPLSNLPDNPKRDLSRVDNWFVVGDFIKEADPRSSKYIERFYEQQREVDQLYAAFNQARALGDLDRARELAGDDRLKLRGLFKAADKQMDRINRDIKRLENSALPAEEKRARLDQLYQARSRMAALADERARAARP